MKDMATSKKRYTIRLTEDILGTCPKDPELYATWVASKDPSGNGHEEVADVQAVEERGWTGFLRDDHGLYLSSHMILGYLKNAGEVLRGQVRITKEKKDGASVTEPMKGVRSKIDKYLFISPKKLYFGGHLPDGVNERPIRTMTPQGPRVALIRSDSVSSGVELTFDLELLDQRELTWDHIDFFFQYARLQGLGQWRSGGYGRFEVVRVEPC